MRLPKKIKHFNFFLDGDNYIGRVSEIELPKITRKMEDYRGGGMNAPIKSDMGMEALEMTVTFGGIESDMFKQMGGCRLDSVRARVAGSLEGDDTCEAIPLEIEITGRFSEMELPNIKSGEDSEQKFMIAISYLRILYQGSELCEIDIVNMIEKWHGRDRLEDHKTNIGA